MPLLNSRPPKFKPKRDLQAEWDSWRKGLNLLLRPTELGRDEMAQADNIILVGSGVPTGRWGSSSYFSANATGSIRGFGTFVNTTSLTNEIFALTDEGFLAKKNGSSSIVISGQSYPSGSTIRTEQLGGKTYIASKDKSLTAYDGASLSVFATLSAPTGLSATNISGASGTSTYSWRITTLGNGGETTGSVAVELPNLPQPLSNTLVRVRWTLASGVNISGYQVYRGLPGDETFLASVGPSVSTYDDVGEASSEVVLSPLTNTTGGPLSEFIAKFRDRLLLVDALDRSKLLISGRYVPGENFSFNLADGGGAVYVDPDSGQDIKGIAIQPGSDRIIVYKDFSHHSVELSTVQIGNFIILDPTTQPISTGVGCSSADTIQTVENDTFYFGRKGLYVTGFEPNFLNIIRTNEVSARIRSYLMNLNDNDFNNACSMYVDNKYLLSFPSRKEVVVYDRERGCFAGIWKLPWGISKMLKYVDETGTERWVFGINSNNQVYTFSTSLNTDDGSAIQKTLRTNKETFDQWSLLKIIKLFYILFRRIKGSVNVNILAENRDGSTSVIKSFTIEGSAVSGSLGWGIDQWGTALWGTSAGTVVTAGEELYKWTQLFKSVRLIQIEVTTTTAQSNFELLNMRMTASSQGEGSLSSSART